MAFSSSSSSQLSASPNVTPLIDVLLVLLIIFMTIVPVSPHGLESLLPRPARTSVPSNEPAPLTLEVRYVGAGQAIMYRLNGQIVDRMQLTSSLRQAQARSTTRAILVAGDPRLDFQPVVTAISEAQQAGFHSIGLLPRSPVSGQ